MSQLPNDIPSNSQKSKEQKAQTNARPEVIPFDGDVGGAKRKKSKVGAWLKKMFLSDRKPSEILMDAVENNIVPGVKDNFRNSIVNLFDMFIYQNAKPPTANSANNSISYNNIFKSSAPAKPANTQTQSNNGVDLSNGFANPCFKTRVEAERFLVGKMQTYDYPTLSVHTMYMMMSKHIDYTWDAYGWNREEIASWDPKRIITHINSADWPWMIDLPQPHVLT